MDDLISRQAAIDAADAVWSVTGDKNVAKVWDQIKELPSVQPELAQDLPNACTDAISRQAAIDALHMHLMYRMGTDSNKKRIDEWINNLPSAQPERTCVNCGRTANNGGWYADGRTRCPIEEHYALPKDGFCHLWEKRNVTDDDYPKKE